MEPNVWGIKSSPISLLGFVVKLWLEYIEVSFQPFVLRSQLYSGVKDRTQVDRELEVISDLFVKCIFIFVFSAS
ncbi:hypothetical protein CFP56_027482 [Quercus suber]|uniref:Uncharacterized protein n=1 Tax=Quercus suber TaxID=58331 RepID=A0AAW0JYK6_QUESU